MQPCWLSVIHQDICGVFDKCHAGCRVVVTAIHTEKDILKAVAALIAAVKEVCKVSRVATRSSYMTLGST